MRSIHGLRLSIAVLCVICTLSPNVVADDPLANLADDCQALIALQKDSALQQDSKTEDVLVASACPQLAAALRDSKWRDTLIGTTPDTLTIEQVRDFVILTERYAAPAQSNPSLTRQSLDSILKELPTPRTEERSVWDRIWDWLKATFESQTETDLATLLERLTGWIKADWILSMIQLGFAGAAAAAVVIFVRELRRAGVFGKRNQPVDRTDQPSAAAPHDSVLADVPPRSQPAFLLGVVVRRLQGSALPAQAPSMTIHEIRQQVISLAEPVQQQFLGLASGAERIAYADWQPDESQLGDLITTGENLLQSLSRKENS